MAEMKFVTVNGLTLHYRCEGVQGDVPLVFINSLGCDLRIWDSVVGHLMGNFPIVRFDKRGHGLSDSPPPPYSMRELAEDAIGLLDQLGIDKAILVGVSVGGMVALQTALDFPQRVKALILCDTAARIATAEYWNNRINLLREHGMLHIADSIVSRWFSPDFIEQNPAGYRGCYNMLARMPLEGYIGTCAALRDSDLRDQVKTIAVPALVLCGAQDLATPPEVARELADSLPNARFMLIEDAAHIPSVEQPQAVADAIMEFLKEHTYV